MGPPEKRTGPELMGDGQLRELLLALSRPLPVQPHSSAALAPTGSPPARAAAAAAANNTPAAAPVTVKVADLLGLGSFDEVPSPHPAPAPHTQPTPVTHVSPSSSSVSANISPSHSEGPLLPAPLSIDDPSVAADAKRYSTLLGEVHQLVADLSIERGETAILTRFRTLCRNFAEAVENSQRFDTDYVHLMAMLYRTEEVVTQEAVWDCVHASFFIIMRALSMNNVHARIFIASLVHTRLKFLRIDRLTCFSSSSHRWYAKTDNRVTVLRV